MNRHECERLYLQGLSIFEISNKTGQPQNKIRAWKSRHKWGMENISATQQSNKATQIVKTNTNQKPKGGQPENKNALTHGIYSKTIHLTHEEKEWLNNAIFIDELESLQREVAMCEIRIVRHMRTIEQLNENPAIANKTVNVTGEERGQNSNYTQQEEINITLSQIDKLNAEITKLSNSKGNHIKRIVEIKAQREKQQIETEDLIQQPIINIIFEPDL